MRIVFSSLLVFMLIFSSAVAMAQDDEDEAMTFFKKGIDLFNSESYEEAAAAFRKAYELKPNWKLNYNIGQSEAAAKRLGLALQAFEAYLSQGGDDIPTERRDEVLKEVERLRKMVGAVEVDAPEGAVIFVDGVERGVSPLPGALPIAASVEHKVAVSIDGEKTDEQTVQVIGGQTSSLTFEKPVAAPKETQGTQATQATGEPAQTPREDKAAVSPIKIWGWVAVGLGGALVAGGVATGAVALSMNKELEQDCDPSCGSDYQSDVDKRDGLALTADILIPTGAAFAAAGILMLTVFAPDDESETGEAAALQPIIGPGAIGASVSWRF